MPVSNRKFFSALMIALLLSVSMLSAAFPTRTVGQAQGQQQTTPVELDMPVGLYIGGTNLGVVYKYVNDTLMQISQQLGFSITSIVYFDGKLYVGAITSPDSSASRGLVYRKDGETWTLIGELDNQVCFLIGYKGHLYAGTGIGSARLYRWVPETQKWIKVIEYPAWYGFRSAYVWNDWLYLGDWYWDNFARWNGTIFEDLGFYGGSCIYSFEEYEGYLYAGAYRGVLYRISHDPARVERVWQEPDHQYIWALKWYGDYLYIGTAWSGYGAREGRLYRYNGTHIELVWSKPVNNVHEGVISLTTDGLRLFIGVGGQAVGYPGSPEKEAGARANATQGVYPFYMPAGGVGQVWQYDGENFELIADSLGTGVQSLLPGAIYIPLKMRMEPSERSIIFTVAMYITGKIISATFATIYDRDCDGKITLNEFIKNLGEEFSKITVLDLLTLGFGTYLGSLVKAGKISVPWRVILAHSLPLISAVKPFFTNFAKYSTYNPETKEYLLSRPLIQIGFLKISWWSPPEASYFFIVGHEEEPPSWTADYSGFATKDEKIITAYGKVDLQVTDQYGRVVNKTVSHIEGASYIEADFDGDGVLDDRIILPRTAGLFYDISVIPEPDAAPNDTYTLIIGSAGIDFTIARNVAISEIPERGYALSSEEPPERARPFISVRLNVTARALNISDSAIFGVANATEGFDVVFDEPKPPSPSCISAYFHYPDNPIGFQVLSASYVNLTDSMSWPLRIKYNGTDTPIEISWNTVETNMFPLEYRLLLHTPEGILVDMREKESYVFSATTGTYNFTITAVRTGLVKRAFPLYAGLNLFSIPQFLSPSDFAVQIGGVYPLNISSYDPSSLTYISAATSDVGRGYWIKVFDNITVEVVGYPVPATEFPILLQPGWNLIGNPFEQAINVSSLRIFNPATGDTVSFKEAVARGWIYRYLYWYDPIARRYMVVSPDGVLEPFKGYWVKGYEKIVLIIAP